MKRQTDISLNNRNEKSARKDTARSAEHPTSATEMGSTNSKCPSTKKFQSLFSHLFIST